MISPEDKKDVKNHLGKALANKVSKVTNDSKMTAFKRSNPEMKAARKGYNDARAADGLSKHRGTFSIGGNPIKNGKKVWDSINKTGKYESPAAKKALKASHERQESYAKERAERYKREGISE